MAGNSRPKILVRLDADHHVGLAHGVRVATILSLTELNFDLHLIGNLPRYDEFFDPDIHIHPLPSEGMTEQEKARKVVEVAAAVEADLLMVDHPRLSRISWDIFADSALPLIAIDDEGGPVRADLIFNGTVLDAYHHYPRMGNSSHIHCGGEYALINPCFGRNLWTDPAGKSLITVIGSGDRACDWAFRLTGGDGPLSRLDIARKTMIVGSAFPRFDLLAKNCQDSNISLHQGLDQHSLANMLSRHSAGLITGGMIVYEALATGLPVMVFPQERNLPPEAHFFAGRGSLIDLGYDGGMDMGLIEHEIKKMMNCSEKRLTLSRKARQLIDGKGMLRTIEILDSFIRKIQQKNYLREYTP